MNQTEINEETLTLSDTLDQIDITSTYRAFHPKAAEYMCTWNIVQDSNTFSYKTSSSKSKKTDIISSIFSNYNTVKTEYKFKKKKIAEKQTHEGQPLFY